MFEQEEENERVIREGKNETEKRKREREKENRERIEKERRENGIIISEEEWKQTKRRNTDVKIGRMKS